MKQGRRLVSIKEFPPAVRAGAAQLSLATAEEFLAQAAFDEPGLRSALGVSDRDFEEALSAARQAAGPQFMESLTSMNDAPDYHYGALPPTSDEFRTELRREQTGELDDHQAGAAACRGGNSGS